MTELEKQLYGRPLTELIESLAPFRRLEACWRLIETEFMDEELSLGDVARRCAISENHLNRRLKENIGLSFHELLHRYRLQTACRMLREKDYSLLEVALETGFGNPSSLRRYFQQVLGCTPREYREQCRKRANVSTKATTPGLTEDFGDAPEEPSKAEVAQER